MTGVLYTRLGFGPDRRRVFQIGISTRINATAKKDALRKNARPLST